MIGAGSERGAALLSVLLLVAVMATVAATTLDRVTLATRLAGNAATSGQARAWLGTAEQLASTRIEDLLGADQSQTTLAGGWLGVDRSIALPDGGIVHVRVEDGSNCFNLNSLVEQREASLVPRPTGGSQFSALMGLLGIPEGEAAGIAVSATAYLADSGMAAPTRDGNDGVVSRLMADPSELRAVHGVSARHYGMLERWICALPTTDLAPINVNTLLAEQAPLLAMLDPIRIDLNRARAQLASRPPQGYGSVLNFWNSPAFKDIGPSQEASQQIKVKSSFFTLRARVAAGDIEFSEAVQIDARATPVRIVRRHFSEAM